MLKHLYGNTLTVLLLPPVTKESTPSLQSLFPSDSASEAAMYTEALPMCDKSSLNIEIFRSNGLLLARSSPISVQASGKTNQYHGLH